jgi:putative ABC transport system permease protein
VLAGLVLGVLGAMAAARLVEGLLFDVSAKEPAAYAAVVAIFSGVAIVACYVPARRVARIDPVQALRWE